MKFGVNYSNFLLNSSTFLLKINNLPKLITEAGLYDKQDASRFPVFHHSCLLRCIYKFVPPVFSGIQICYPCVHFKENCNVHMQVDKFIYKVDK